MNKAYVHGYDRDEVQRLQDQAATLVDLLHGDTSYPADSLVLEVGCGVGAQTVTLAQRSPQAQFLSIDVSEASLVEARRRIASAGINNVEFRQADLFELPLAEASVDHVFLCFVLEHLSRPAEALSVLLKILKPGGSMTVIEGDHGSAYFHPDSDAARSVIDHQITLQRQAGGDALIGRRVYPLMAQAGLTNVRVSPRLVYADASRPALVDGFILKTFTAMIAGVRDASIRAELTTADAFDAGLRDLMRTAEPDGVFSYCFFKGVGIRPG
jgi:SAM-dependent methyltransferase